MISRIHEKQIVILGAGPTGLGAAHRLHEMGIQNVKLFERNHYAGGLAASFVDPNGFTWDIGGHVQFSHYDYFDHLMDELLPGEWLEHQRESWVWIRERFVPYPFQNNIHYLPETEAWDCLRGLIRLRNNGHHGPPANFGEWIERSFGEGIAKVFLEPYNFKVWAYPPAQLSHSWVGERVATVDLERIVSNVLTKRSDVSWGPNNMFRFPQRGGTGEIWRRLARRLPASTISFGKNLVALDTEKRRIQFEDGSVENYDVLISTIPLDVLIERSNLRDSSSRASNLLHSTVHIIGVGLKGAPPPSLKTKSWMYFPEEQCPFYRATVFSNYSPNNVPDASKQWSLMLEVSQSPAKPVDEGAVIDQTVQGLINTRMIESKSEICSIWHYKASYGYPTPSIGRDDIVHPVNAVLEKAGIYSRGRFGAWKYEVSNQDHSLMQGVELANRLAFGVPEITYSHPAIANKPR